MRDIYSPWLMLRATGGTGNLCTRGGPNEFWAHSTVFGHSIGSLSLSSEEEEREVMQAGASFARPCHVYTQTHVRGARARAAR